VPFVEATRGKPGGVNNPEGLGGKSGKTADIVKCDNVTLDKEPTPEPAITKKPSTGNSTSYAVRRLGKGRPDLLERLKAGKMSANAAMIAAVHIPELFASRWVNRTLIFATVYAPAAKP
jgi:hypothetical protein